MPWKFVNQNLIGNRNSSSTDLNKYTVKELEQKWKVPLSSLIDGRSNVYTNPTVDSEQVYITTQGNFEDGIQVNGDSSVICINRKSGTIQWKRTISSYTGSPNESTRSAPAVWKNFIFVGTAHENPQTFNNPIGPVTGRFTGQPVAGSGSRPHVLCINKCTGDLVWSVPVGKVASNISDEDNWLIFTQSPIVFDAKVESGSRRRPIVAIGTSSLQSFAPWFLNLGGQVLGERFDFQMTDRGRLLLLDAFDGTILKTIFTCPSVLKAGDSLPASSLIPGQSEFYIRHVVAPEDLQPGGVLNPIQDAYAITSRLTYVLETGESIPTPCDGVEVVNADNIPVILVGGDVVTADLNQVVVRLDATLVSGKTTMTVDGQNYDVTDPAVGLTSGVKVARIGKKLEVGDELSAADAYQCNYFGASVWANTSAIQFDSRGKVATQIIIPSGQSHSAPYDESEYMNNPATNYITCSNLIGTAQQNYIQDPTLDNYQLMQDAYLKYDQSIQDRLALVLSERGQRNWHASYTNISLQADTFGEPVWQIKRDNYDLWNIGYTVGPRSAISPGWSDIQQYYEQPAGPDGDFGQGPSFYQKCGVNRMVSLNKGGFLEVHDLNVSPPTLLYRKQVGNSVPIGVSNFGSAISGSRYTSINFQAYNPTDVNKGFPSPYNYPARLRWYTSPDEYYDINQSFVQCFNVRTLEFEWDRVVLPKDTAPYTPTIAQVTSSKSLVYVPAADGTLQIRDLSSGRRVGVIELDSVAGQSAPAIVDNEIYVALGRDTLSGYSSQYQPAHYLRKFGLDRCSCRYC